MTAAVIISLVVPIAAVAAFLMARSRLPKIAADIRGIALQTVIIMVVLLAIAGAVAGVLLTRGGETVDDLERQEISRDAGDFTNQSLCEAAGFSWSGDSTCLTP